MKAWSEVYVTELQDRIAALAHGLSDRLDAVVQGKVAPDIESMPIGSARLMRASVLFFDIRGFSARTGSAEPEALKRVLAMLDVVTPTVMSIVYDHGGYVEKNTGDGVMAIFAEGNEQTKAEDALDAAATIAYAIKQFVNPQLTLMGIEPIDYRMGMDLGTMLIARIGVPSGSSKHPRSFLTAVGPSANVACRIQQAAGTNEIWTGYNVVAKAVTRYKMDDFQICTPPDWPWLLMPEGTQQYSVFNLISQRTTPFLKVIGDLLKANYGK